MMFVGALPIFCADGEEVPRCFSEAHFATFPEALVEPCILAGCPDHGTHSILSADPERSEWWRSGIARNCIVIDLNSEYCEMARRRIAKPDQIYLLLEFTIERSAADTSLPHPTSQR